MYLDKKSSAGFKRAQARYYYLIVPILYNAYQSEWRLNYKQTSQQD